MTAELLDAARRGLVDHGAFREGDAEDAYAIETTPFDATASLEDAGSGVSYRIVIVLPTLDAAVEGETVAPVVQEGWFETFERRVEHVGGVTAVDPEGPLVTLDADDSTVTVEFAFETSIPDRGAQDAKALVDFVEGTYLQGVIRGYEYREPVAGLIARAEDRSESAGGPPI